MTTSKIASAYALLALMTAGNASATIIGPDAYGYTASNEIAFNWIDISGTGTATGMSDDTHVRASLGFTFSMYGTPTNTVSIGSNGTVYFQDAYLGLANTSIPGSNGYNVHNNVIAVYWDDLNPGAGGDVYYQTIGTAGQQQFIVQWNSVPHFAGATSDFVTAQAILFESTGDILLQYLFASSEMGSGATVGIQRDVDNGLQWSFNQAVLDDGSAICISAAGTTCNAVPEPSSLALLGLGLAGLGFVARRKR